MTWLDQLRRRRARVRPWRPRVRRQPGRRARRPARPHRRPAHERPARGRPAAARHRRVAAHRPTLTAPPHEPHPHLTRDLAPRPGAFPHEGVTMRSSRTTALAMAGVLSLGLLAACSTNDDPAGDSSTSGDGKVTITVAGLQPGAEQTAVDALNERVDGVRGEVPGHQRRDARSTTGWRRRSPPHLAGGTLPNVFEIPLTDAKTLIENGQLADIDAQVKQLPVRRRLQQEPARGRHERRRQGLRDPGQVHLRASRCTTTATCSTQAGLDPDKPPTTWDEVREYAKTIHDKTGVAGLRDDGARQRRRLAADRRGVLPRRRHPGARRRQVRRPRWTTRPSRSTCSSCSDLR